MANEPEFLVMQVVNKLRTQAREMHNTLETLNGYLDREVSKLGDSRTELETLLQENESQIPAGYANQLWSRLGKYDRHIEQMYARQQNAAERLIELRAHLDELALHNAGSNDEATAFMQACFELVQKVLGDATNAKE